MHDSVEVSRIDPVSSDSSGVIAHGKYLGLSEVVMAIADRHGDGCRE